MIFGKYINKFYLKYWYLFFFVILFDVLVDVFQLMIPRLIGNIISILTPLENREAFMTGTLSQEVIDELGLPFYSTSFTSCLIAMAVITVVIVLGRMGWRFFSAHIGAYIERDLRKEMYAHIQTMSLTYFKDKKVGGLLSYFTQDLQTIKQLYIDGFIFMTDLLCLGTLSLVYMFQLSWALTLVSAAPMVLFIIFGNRIGSGISKRYKISSDAFENLSDYTEENLQGFSVIKAFRKEKDRVNTFDGITKDVSKKSVDYLRYSSYIETGIYLFLTVTYALMLGFGSYALIQTDTVFRGSMKAVGDFYTFVGYNDSLIWPMMAGGILINEMSMAKGCYKRIETILDAKPDVVDKKDAIKRDHIQGNVVFKNLTFSYPDGSIPVLSDVSFEVKPGMTVGVIGRTGSGKSTLVSLLSKLYNIEPGMLTIDGVDINDWRKADLREHIGFVSQEAFLFSGLLKDSVAFSESKLGAYDEKKVREACQFASIDKDIMEFKDGYDTIVGERGATLSGGQRQRVSIARAIYKNPDLLILDDSLSAVDADTEKKILSNISKERKAMTTFIIAHRISAIEESDLILVLDQGQLVGKGKHDELYENCQLYHNLVEMQRLEKEVN